LRKKILGVHVLNTKESRIKIKKTLLFVMNSRAEIRFLGNRNMNILSKEKS
jgi:hypothetical protein